MKSVTEFSSLKLADGIAAKTAFAAEGKTPEEIAAALGEKFKFEGDKLKYFVNAVEIAEKSAEKLFAVKIVKLNEGQNPPPRGTVIEELCYITEPLVNPADRKVAPPTTGKSGRGDSRGGGGKPRGKGGKPKDSPWGISPEEKEAKLAAARQAQREKSLAGKS